MPRQPEGKTHDQDCDRRPRLVGSTHRRMPRAAGLEAQIRPRRRPARHRAARCLEEVRREHHRRPRRGARGPDDRGRDPRDTAFGSRGADHCVGERQKACLR